jgi:hypothetical protein
MAQAADSPIGFRSAAKVRVPGICLPDDGSLAGLHAWQASSAGLAQAQIFSLGSTIADLTRLAASPPALRLLIAELPNLELVYLEIAQLISRLRATRERAT